MPTSLALLWWGLLIATCLNFCVASYVVARLKRASVFTSLPNRLAKLEALSEDLESRCGQYDLRLKRITSRMAMATAREKLTETSQDSEPEEETKDAVKRRLGLIGANAPRAAFDIHSRGGLSR